MQASSPRATLTTKRKSFENETSRFCTFLDSSTSFDLNVLLVMISYNKFEDETEKIMNLWREVLRPRIVSRGERLGNPANFKG